MLVKEVTVWVAAISDTCSIGTVKEYPKVLPRGYGAGACHCHILPALMTIDNSECAVGYRCHREAVVGGGTGIDSVCIGVGLLNIGEEKRTKEIEKSILSQKIDSIDYINSSLQLTPDVMIAYDAGMPHKNVYPYLEGFESLDVSDLDAEAANVIAQFCTNLVRKESCDSFMAKDSVYALAMFLYDAGECSFDFTNARWLLGKPFITESSLEVPAYFYHKSDYLSIKFYLSQVENAYKVFDVEISDTGSRSHLREEKNGK